MTDRHTLVMSLFVMAAAPAAARGTPDAPFWDVPVVTPSGQASRVSESPSTTFVVTGEELRHAGTWTLTEILRRVPGLDVRQLTAMDGQLGLRGFAYELADRILVLVDGRTVHIDFLGATAYEMLPVSLVDVDRVEVVLGPGASIYGNKAMLGTVNIITRSAADYPSTEVRVDASSAAELRYGVRSAAAEGPWRLRATGLARSLVRFAGSEERGTAGGGTFTVGYSPNPGLETSFEVGAMTGETWIIPTAAQIRAFDATLAHARARARFGLGGPGAPAGDVVLDLVWNGVRVRSDTFPGPEGMHGRGDTPYLQASHELRSRIAGAPASLRWGGDVRLNTLATTITVDETPIWNVAGFASGEVVLDRLRLTAGVRVDRSTLSGPSVSPRLSAVWTPAEGHQLRAAFNTGFNDPNLLTRFGDFMAGALPVRGSRRLGPERTIHGEVAWAGSLTAWLHGFASAFAYRFEDWVSLQPDDLRTLGYARYGNNADPVGVLGGEGGLEIAPNQRVSGYASYALLVGTSASERPYCGAEPHGSPRHKVGGGVRIALREGAYLTADAQWVGHAELARLPGEGDDPPPDGCLFVPTPLDPYLTLGARLGYAFSSGLDLSVAGSNLLSDRTRQFPRGEAPERRLYATLSFNH